MARLSGDDSFLRHDWQYTYIQDVTKGIELAVTTEAANCNATYFLAPDEGPALQYWIETAAGLMGRTIVPLHLPLPLVKAVTVVLSPIMNMHKNRTFMYEPETINRYGGCSLAPLILTLAHCPNLPCQPHSMAENRTYSNALLKRYLGLHNFTSAAQGLAETVAELQASGRLPRLPASPVFMAFGALMVLLLGHFAAKQWSVAARSE